MTKDITPIEKLEFIVAQYAKDNGLLRDLIIMLIETIQLTSDMDNPRVREIMTLALLAIGENPADAE